MTAPTAAGWSRGRLVLLAAGLAMTGVGVVSGLTSIPSDQWPSVLLWMAGAVAVHDAVLAPLAIVLGLAVLPRVRPGWRAPLRAGALGAAVLGVFAVGLLAGAAGRRNPSVVPQDPATALFAATALLVVAVVAGILTQRVLAARATRRGRPGQDRTTPAGPSEPGA